MEPVDSIQSVRQSVGDHIHSAIFFFQEEEWLKSLQRRASAIEGLSPPSVNSASLEGKTLSRQIDILLLYGSEQPDAETSNL